MHSMHFGRSAALLLWGVVLLVAGQVLGAAGLQSTISAAMSRSYGEGEGQGLIVLGGGVAVFGLAFVLLGLHRLATNVDLAAFAAARVLQEREQTDAQSQAEPDLHHRLDDHG